MCDGSYSGVESSYPYRYSRDTSRIVYRNVADHDNIIISSSASKPLVYVRMNFYF